MQNHDPQVLPKASNCLKQGRAAFAFAKDFFWCRSAVGDLPGTVTLFGIHIIFITRLSLPALSQEHQGFIDDYPGKPSRESGTLAELLKVHERPLERALHGIFRILLIADNAESGAIGFALMTVVQFSEGIVVS